MTIRQKGGEKVATKPIPGTKDKSGKSYKSGNPSVVDEALGRGEKHEKVYDREGKEVKGEHFDRTTGKHHKSG